MAEKGRIVLTPQDLASEDFVVMNNKVHIQMTRQELVAKWVGQATGGAANRPEWRRSFTVQNGYGQIHLDFKLKSGSGGEIAKLPDDAPTPVRLLEVQTNDGGTVWLDPQQRTIKGGGLKPNTRYIVDLVGYFS